MLGFNYDPGTFRINLRGIVNRPKCTNIHSHYALMLERNVSTGFYLGVFLKLFLLNRYFEFFPNRVKQQDHVTSISGLITPQIQSSEYPSLLDFLFISGIVHGSLLINHKMMVKKKIKKNHNILYHVTPTLFPRCYGGRSDSSSRTGSVLKRLPDNHRCGICARC